MVILLEPEVWNESIVSRLVQMGHTVQTVGRTGFDLLIGPHCWRVPTGKTSLKDIEAIVKQAHKLIKAKASGEYPTLTIPQEVADGMEDQEISQQEADGPAAERVITAYRPAKKPGRAKRRAKVSSGTDCGTDTGC